MDKAWMKHAIAYIPVIATFSYKLLQKAGNSPKPDET